MWSFIQRLWRIVTGSLHEVADKFEEPIKMTTTHREGTLACEAILE